MDRITTGPETSTHEGMKYPGAARNEPGEINRTPSETNCMQTSMSATAMENEGCPNEAFERFLNVDDVTPLEELLHKDAA
jgi:hypothetical protein